MKKHSYAVVVNEIGRDESPPLVAFEFTSHDDIATIIENASAKGLFDEERTKAFVLGVKLFSGVMLENRDNPLFTEIAPAFGQFMKRLKSS